MNVGIEHGQSYRSFSGNRNFQQRPMREFGPISLDFPEYKGEKVHEMPDEFVEFLTKRDEKSQVVGTSETDVGITEFREPDLVGFDAILKHRFSDFNVNEIDLDGNIVRLTDLNISPSVAKVVTSNI
jgi:hypothetical protein